MMNNEGQKADTGGAKPISNKIHRILAHSYSFYFIALLAGILLDILFPLRIFKSSATAPVGLTFLVLATLLIFWAQHTSRNLADENLSKESFCRGPYCYTRSPTHWGLFLLTLGFGIVANASFVVISTIVSFFITKFIFIKKQEEILEQKYGTPYLEYKKAVKF